MWPRMETLSLENIANEMQLLRTCHKLKAWLAFEGTGIVEMPMARYIVLEGREEKWLHIKTQIMEIYIYIYIYI